MDKTDFICVPMKEITHIHYHNHTSKHYLVSKTGLYKSSTLASFHITFTLKQDIFSFYRIFFCKIQQKWCQTYIMLEATI